jgi:hypothetical protein
MRGAESRVLCLPNYVRWNLSSLHQGFATNGEETDVNSSPQSESGADMAGAGERCPSTRYATTGVGMGQTIRSTKP